MQTVKKIVNEYINNKARRGKVAFVRLKDVDILEYMQEEGINPSLKQRKRLQKLVNTTNNAVPLRKMLRGLGKKGDLYQIKNRIVRNGFQVDLRLGTFITML